MTAVMEGVRVLEVAEHTFVPAASALLADWGADVIKIEPIERGDAMRGLAATGVVSISGDVHALLEHSNRGKRSLALDLTTPEGLDILYKLVATADVFLINKLPRVRKKLSIELEDIRKHNPNIIYVAGTGQGERGPDADKGSYDSLSFWFRAGVSLGATPADQERLVGPPGPGFGDSIGAMTIAGGIMGALFHRERTGEATTVDVSLLGTGMWAMGQAFALSLVSGTPWGGPPAGAPRLNPLVRNYETKDKRSLSFCCLQASRYWADLCVAIGRPELATDPRFADHAGLIENSVEGQRAPRRGLRRAHRGGVARAAGRLHRPVVRRAGHARVRRRPPGRRQRLHAGLRDGERHALPIGGLARAVRRRALAGAPGPRVQRARRRHPRGSRGRLGYHRRSQGPLGRRVGRVAFDIVFVSRFRQSFS